MILLPLGSGAVLKDGHKVEKIRTERSQETIIKKNIPSMKSVWEFHPLYMDIRSRNSALQVIFKLSSHA